MIYKLYIFIFVGCFLDSFSQDKTFNNWHFGANYGLTFNTNPASILNGSALITLEGSSSISDSLGNTLFYTDGVSVYDKNNILMPNGFGLNGHSSSTQSALIVKNPSKNNIYYIFTTSAEAGIGFIGCGCFSYSIVDLNLNNGNGDVTSKNILLYNNTSEKLAGYNNQKDSVVWIVTHEYNTNNFYTYKVDSNGVNTTPVISNCGIIGTLVQHPHSAIGQLKISPDGTKIANCTYKYNIFELYDFNDFTGVVSNALAINTNYYYNYGVEFSPNSKLLYVSNTEQNSYIMQYNLINYNVNAILNSAIVIDHQYTFSTPYGSLQLAPDGKIYIAKYNSAVIFLISKPDVLGTGCQFGYPGIWIGPYSSRLGLPNHVAGYYKTTYVPPIEEPIIEVCENYIIPNAITPNNDGINDEFKITCDEDIIEPQSLIIYNRWGEFVFNRDKGINNLNDVTDGVYFYTFKIDKISYKGFLNIFH
ncbi:MAG: hypothetical protein C0448_14545 [Sphingobacteriaceae bacterium]|nr:hypothetical protein [Sphingobacteriaceae bacterium]